MNDPMQSAEERVAAIHELDMDGEIIGQDEEDLHIFRPNARPFMPADKPCIVSRHGIHVTWAMRAHPLSSPGDIIGRLMFSLMDGPQYHPGESLVRWRVDEVTLRQPLISLKKCEI